MGRHGRYDGPKTAPLGLMAARTGRHEDDHLYEDDRPRRRWPMVASCLGIAMVMGGAGWLFGLGTAADPSRPAAVVYTMTATPEPTPGPTATRWRTRTRWKTLTASPLPAPSPEVVTRWRTQTATVTKAPAPAPRVTVTRWRTRTVTVTPPAPSPFEGEAP